MDKEQKELREQLGRVWEEYKTFRDALPGDSETWTAEQEERFAKFDTDIDALEGKIAAAQRKARDAEREKRFAEPETRSGAPETGGQQGDLEEKRNQAFERGLAYGIGALTEEQRGLVAGTDAEGGYLVTPEKFISTLLKNVDDQVQIRKLATIHPLKKAASLGVITLAADAEDWEWTTELATGSDDDAMRFGKRSLAAYPLAKRIKMSKTLIRLSNRNVQNLVSSRMAYKLGGTLEKHYMTGSGSSQPLGLFTPSANGISTARDCATDNTATKLTADNLIEVQGMLKDAYQGKARWLFHRTTITALRKLKDSDGQYLWVPGLQQGAANTILGKPYITSEWTPNAMTSGKYVGMYADFSNYWITDCLDMTIQVLNELYAETNQIGYIGRYEGDGQPVLEESFVRIKMGGTAG